MNDAARPTDVIAGNSAGKTRLTPLSLVDPSRYQCKHCELIGELIGVWTIAFGLVVFAGGLGRVRVGQWPIRRLGRGCVSHA